MSSIQREARLSIVVAAAAVADPPNLERDHRRASASEDREPNEQGLSVGSDGEPNHATNWEPLSPPVSFRSEFPASLRERERNLSSELPREKTDGEKTERNRL